MSHSTEHDRLRHIVDAAEAALRFMAGKSRADLDGDLQLQYAVVRCFEIIGEASTAIGETTRQRFPSVPWQLMVRMRHRLVHHYNDVDTEIIWHTVRDDLGPLIQEIVKVIPPENL